MPAENTELVECVSEAGERDSDSPAAPDAGPGQLWQKVPNSEELVIALTLGAVLWAPLLFPQGAMQSVVQAVGLGTAALLLCVGLLRRQFPVGPQSFRIVVLATLTVAWMLARSLASANPAVSIIGVYGLSAGSASVLLAVAWLLVGMMFGLSALRHVLLVVGLSGAAFSVLAWIEAVTTGARFQGSAAGAFENSMTLGGFLSVAALSLIALAFGSASKVHRVFFALAALLAASGVFAAGSRAGLVGLLAALAFASAVWLARRRSRVAEWSVLILGAVVLAATVLGVFAARGSLGAEAQTLLDQQGTSRGVIWRSAWATISEHPLAGRGPQQFTAVIDWVVDSRGMISMYATNDSHNVVLALLLGGGIIGLLLVVTAVAAVMISMIRKATRLPRPAGVLVASMPVTLVAAGLFSWIGPSALVCASLIAGLVLRGAVEREGRLPRLATTSYRVAVVGLAACTAAVAVLATGALVYQVRYESLLAKPDATTVSQLLELYRRYPEPGFAFSAVLMIGPGAMQGDSAELERVKDVLRIASRDVPWSVDLAAVAATVAIVESEQSEAGHETVVKALENGRSADPSTSLWDAVVAMDASQRGLDAVANDYAVRVLRGPVSQQQREIVETAIQR
ncbi:MAG: O-antigen ligase family protein [Coriobacteriia bacterium]|nr:O-antigen ligase family protein [Coriobacteriia bacterium]